MQIKDLVQFWKFIQNYRKLQDWQNGVQNVTKILKFGQDNMTWKKKQIRKSAIAKNSQTAMIFDD